MIAEPLLLSEGSISSVIIFCVCLLSDFRLTSASKFSILFYIFFSFILKLKLKLKSIGTKKRTQMESSGFTIESSEWNFIRVIECEQGD